MKYYISIILTVLFFYQGNAQRLHNPAEVLRIMEKSKIQYKIIALDSLDNIPKYALIRGWPTEKNGRLQITPYKPVANASFQKNFTKGLRNMGKNRFAKAIKYFNKAHRVYPQDVLLLSKLGETYTKSKDQLSAIYWYNKALDINFHDYQTHLLLAQAHALNQDTAKAQKHILMAHLLNRLSPEIKKAMLQIFQNQQMAFAEWELQPKTKVDSESFGSVQIAYEGAPWLAYANVEAIWDYEPEYRVKMASISNQNGNLVKLKEAMLNALIIYDGLEAEEQKDFPSLECFKNALHNEYLNEYLVYEKLSLTQPAMLYRYNQAGIQRFVDYLLLYRVKKQ